MDGGSGPVAVAGAADIGAALAPRAAEIAADVYGLIVREIPELRGDSRALALLDASVAENVSAALHILQHGIDLEHVRTPTAAEEYARRLAQRGVSMAALLRAYRVGSTRFLDWCLRELGHGADRASVVSATALQVAEVVATYIDHVSEAIVSAYDAERGNWLRNLGIARAARVQVLLTGERADVASSESILGYRLGQHHLGLIGWVDEADAGGGTLAHLERAVTALAGRAGCEGRPIFVPQDESCAWAWLPLGAGDAVALRLERLHQAEAAAGFRFAVGAEGSGLAGFRRTHQQALGAQAVALAAGPGGPAMTHYRDVASLALMSGSVEFLRAWVVETLGPLAADDAPTARLRETLWVFLRENGSFKATAERLTLHKNTVQYRVRKAEESLGRPVEENRLDLELALHATHWLGAAVLTRPADTRH